MPEVKQRTITDKDWQQVETHIKSELDKRQNDSFRKQHERIWKEIDRQIYMKNSSRVNNDPKQKNDWHNQVELGELAKASEIITADVMRLAFPNTRAWFEAHVELPPQLDPNTGANLGHDPKAQTQIDGALRAFMAQQHLDFGFKSRVSLSIKEALHHGSYAVEVLNEEALLVRDGYNIQSVSSPVWIPHSMWNCFPDPSPSIMGNNIFYNGSMIIRSYIPRYKLLEGAKGEGWMPDNLKKVKKKNNKNKDVETEDVELIKYYGDCVIKKGSEEILLPNSRVILANGTIVFYAPNKLPFPNIIYGGYEKLDVRDPYYTSPLIKLSPMHKAASIILNKYLDGIALKTEPPILYDGNDPTFIANGGPVVAPGWKGPTKALANYKIIETGDPSFALQGLQTVMEQIKTGMSADYVGSYQAGNEKTATEIRARQQRGEVRVVDFVDKLEHSMKSFLYMQHEINKQEMTNYSFYNPEMDAPDFMRISVEELPQNVHFDVVGSRGILGEEERAQKTSVVTAFASGNPMFAPLLKRVEILTAMYQDAGVKNPEQFINVPTDETELIRQEIEAQFKQILDEMKAKIEELEKDLAIQKAVNEAKLVEADIKAKTQAGVTEYKAQVQAELDSIKTGLKMAEANMKNQPQAQQVSIAEIGSLIKTMESLLDKEKKESEKEEKDVEKKLEAMMTAIKEMSKTLSKPRKLIRDAKGNAEKVVIED